MALPTIEGLISSAGAQTVGSGTNLNALASNSSVLGSAFSNVQGDGAGGGFPNARAKLHLDSMAVSSGGSVKVWFLTAADGSVYEQGGTSVTPLRKPDIVFVPVVQTAAVDLELPCQVPICGTIKALIQNSSLGASTPANTNGYLKLYYETKQLVNV
jgi:hypothetical protein